MISVIEDAVADEVAAMVKKQRDEGMDETMGRADSDFGLSMAGGAGGGSNAQMQELDFGIEGVGGGGSPSLSFEQQSFNKRTNDQLPIWHQQSAVRPASSTTTPAASNLVLEKRSLYDLAVVDAPVAEGPVLPGQSRIPLLGSTGSALERVLAARRLAVAAKSEEDELKAYYENIVPPADEGAGEKRTRVEETLETKRPRKEEEEEEEEEFEEV